MALRLYQEQAKTILQRALTEKPGALLVAGCGAGKTEIFLSIVEWLRKYNKRALILMDRENLVFQTARRAEKYLGERVGVACKSVSKRVGMDMDVVVASRQTLAPLLRNECGDIKYNLIVIDEAHLSGAAQFKFIVKKLRENYPATRVLLATATPWRMYGGNIFGQKNSFADCIDVQIKTSDLIEQGFLVPSIWKIRKSDLLKQLDMVEKTASGELNETQQGEVLGQTAFVQGVFDVWSQYARGRRTGIYSLNIAHAEKIKEVFCANGVYAGITHSKMSVYAGRKAVESFVRHGPGAVIVNVGQLTVGLDLPSMDCIIMARRTMSGALFFQIVGRAARTCPETGKRDSLIIDLAGSSLQFGIDPDNPVLPAMDDKDSPVPVKVCPLCESACSIQTRVCKSCGFKFPIAEIEEWERREKMRDAGDPGELVDAVPFVTEEAHYIKYVKHRVGKSEAICAFYYGEPPVGKFLGRQYLFTDYRFGKSSVDRTRHQWFNLGGKYPMPKNPAEWIARAGELAVRANVTIDVSGKAAAIKKVEGQGRETPAQAV